MLTLQYGKVSRQHNHFIYVSMALFYRPIHTDMPKILNMNNWTYKRNPLPTTAIKLNSSNRYLNTLYHVYLISLYTHCEHYLMWACSSKQKNPSAITVLRSRQHFLTKFSLLFLKRNDKSAKSIFMISSKQMCSILNVWVCFNNGSLLYLLFSIQTEYIVCFSSNACHLFLWKYSNSKCRKIHRNNRLMQFSSKFKTHHTPQFSLMHLPHVFLQMLVSTWNEFIP